MRRDRAALAASRRGEEVWRDIPGYEGAYQVSNLGRVKSVARTIKARDGRILPIRERIRKPGRAGNYLYVPLAKDGMDKNHHVHRLVLLAFCGPKRHGHDSRHLDGDTDHNVLFNLKYGTRLVNAQDKIRHGTTTRGERSASAKLTERKVRAIKRMLPRMSQQRIADKYGVSQQIISDIKMGRKWAHLNAAVT